jgi:hypothetical protein
MEISDGAKGAASYKNDRGLLWISQNTSETVVREGVIKGVGE